MGVHAALLIALGLLRSEPGRFGVARAELKDLPAPLDDSIRQLISSLPIPARDHLRELVGWVLEFDRAPQAPAPVGAMGGKATRLPASRPFPLA